MSEEKETERLQVVRAAIRIETPFGEIPFSLAQPKRHFEIIEELRLRGYDGPVQGDRQGFILSDGRFVMRLAAYSVARRAGQIRRGELIGSILTSEDLW